MQVYYSASVQKKNYYIGWLFLIYVIFNKTFIFFAIFLHT